jgi:hypothetical protein
MGRPSYLKGNRYMLHMSREISHWWCGTDLKARAADLPFRTRSTSITPVEGHWEGKGDILHRPDLEGFPFAVECKKVEAWTFDSLLEAKAWAVWQWWAQAKSQAKAANHHPLLLFSKNNRKDYALLDANTAHLLGVQPQHAPVLLIERSQPSERVVVCRWEDFRMVPAGDVLKRLRRKRRRGQPHP